MPARWQQLKYKLYQAFRVTVKHEETFEVAGVFSINIANLIALIIGMLILLGLFFYALIALTPLRNTLPGYAAIDDRAEVVALNRQLHEIEAELSAHTNYTQNIQRVLVGDVTKYDKAAEAYLPENAAETDAPVKRIPEDDALRQEMASGRTKFGQSTNEMGIPIDQIHLASPLSGSISGIFDPTNRHFGVDIVAPSNSPVKSMLDGYVVEAGWSIETGNVIAVQHPGNLLSFYKHNASLLKRTGDFVRAGEAIAIIGNTGKHSDGPHVHIELWHRGQPINPARYLRFD